MNRKEIDKLVSDIKKNEKAWKDGTWEEPEHAWEALIASREIAEIAINGTGSNMDSFKYWSSRDLLYKAYMHSLYTLRSYCRGRMHRKNPPQELRGFNRSMRGGGNEHLARSWDMKKHNRYIAEKQSANYQICDATPGAEASR